ncbi:MAG: hypothetical protein U0234_09425 [Sandaracinus sp.]
MADLPLWLDGLVQATAFGLGWFFKDRLERGQLRARATRDYVVDTLGLVRSTEHVLRSIATTQPPPLLDMTIIRERLIDYRSHWTIGDPAIELATFMASQDDDEVRRRAMLFADARSCFAQASEEHRTAFYELLDSRLPHRDPSVRERHRRLVDARDEMRKEALRALRHGYALLNALLQQSDESPFIFMSSFAEEPLRATVERAHPELTALVIKQRAAATVEEHEERLRDDGA